MHGWAGLSSLGYDPRFMSIGSNHMEYMTLQMFKTRLAVVNSMFSKEKVECEKYEFAFQQIGKSYTLVYLC